MIFSENRGKKDAFLFPLFSYLGRKAFSIKRIYQGEEILPLEANQKRREIPA
jgi:hypothetical protein